MIVSMTGFASTTLIITDKQGSQSQVILNLKSLNSRYFEATCKLPPALSHLENDLIKLLKKKLHRGHIVLLLQINNPNLFKGSVQADTGIVKSYLKAIGEIQKDCNIPGTLVIQDIIELPNIFIAEEKTIDEETKRIILDAINQVIEQLIKMRTVEGAALEKDLIKRVDLMQHNMDNIEKTYEILMEKKKEEVNQRLSEVTEHSEDIAEMQRAAMYLELDKMDIHEEIVRFKNHLETFKKTIAAAEEEKGRRLDFILQELARETNTIAAKCGDAEISSCAINIKVEIEKAREQVQNIV